MVSKGLTGVALARIRGDATHRTRNLAHPLPVIPRRRGIQYAAAHPAQSLLPLEYWIVRPSAQSRTRRTMTVEGMAPSYYTTHTSALPRRVSPGLCQPFRPNIALQALAHLLPSSIGRRRAAKRVRRNQQGFAPSSCRCQAIGNARRGRKRINWFG